MTSQSILIVEDEVLIARDLQLVLEDLRYEVPAVATTAGEALAHIHTAAPDLVLLDIHLADGSDGVGVAEAILARWQIPVIFLTAHADAATIARAQATEPYGYLLKPFQEREVAITVQLALAKSRGDRRLRAREHLLATTLRSIAEGVIVTDATGQIVLLNPAAEALTGWSQPEAIGRPLSDVLMVEHADGHIQLGDLVAEVLSQGQVMALPKGSLLRPWAGMAGQVADRIAPLVDAGGTICGVVVVGQAATIPRAAAGHQAWERKLIETQRLESLGLLASCISHDFKNILVHVLGYTELARELIPAKSTASGYLARATSGIHQAAGLATQLMNYAGNDQSCVAVVALNRIVQEQVDLLGGSLLRSIRLQLALDAALPPVLGDSNQIRQVVLNLLTNAAEASLNTAGRVMVSTQRVELTPALRAQLQFGAEAAIGPHICLRVSDSGGGMDPTTLGQIFIPFFTTKVAGHGLGLAAVQGIVRQHRGALRVTSTVGQGTSFEIYLPAAVPWVEVQ